MEMCYDGALVMPKNYSVVSKDEMTYVEGGWYKTSTSYYRNANDAYKNMSSVARTCYRCAVGTAICGAALGAAIGATGGIIGSAFGLAVGAILGLIAGSIIWSFGNAFDNGAIQAKWKGNNSCYVRFTLCNFTLNVSVS